MSGQGRELTAAVLAAVAAGGLGLLAGSETWAAVTAERRPPLPPVTGELSGAEAAPLVTAAGLVLLAAAVALLAVRGAGRAAVGLLMALAGGALAWSAVRALAGGLSEAASEVPGVGQGPGPVDIDVATAWPVVALLAGLLGCAAGLFAVVRGRHWPGMGRRYERGPATPARTAEDRAQAAWTALDRGEDPTEPAPAEPRQQAP